MKKIYFLFLFLIAGSCFSYSQDSFFTTDDYLVKKEIIWKKALSGEMLSVMYLYEKTDDKHPVDTLFSFNVRDHQYEFIEFFGLCIGSASEVCSFLTLTEDFMERNKKDETNEFLIGKRFQMKKLVGGSSLTIYEEKSKSFHVFATKVVIGQAKTALVNWCNANNMKVNCDTQLIKDKVKNETAKVVVVDPTPAKAADNKVEKLRALKSLLDEGIITQEEFDVEKTKILEGN